MYDIDYYIKTKKKSLLFFLIWRVYSDQCVTGSDVLLDHFVQYYPVEKIRSAWKVYMLLMMDDQQGFYG